MVFLLSLLIGIPFVLCASEEEKQVEKTLVYKTIKSFNQTNAGTLDFSNSNLSNNDFTELLNGLNGPKKIDVSHNNIDKFSKTLNLCSTLLILNVSDNKFANAFPLEQCLELFPKLTELAINNNEVTQLAKYNPDWRHNSSLKKYEARNTQCASINIGWLQRQLDLTTLDISDSTMLTRLSGAVSDKGDDVPPLQVILKNTSIPLKRLNLYKQQAWIESKAKDNLRFGTALGMALFFGITYSVLVPQASIAENGQSYVMWGFIGGALGAYLGHIYACNTLPNHGDHQVINFITK